jgi:hypothetical protein
MMKCPQCPEVRNGPTVCARCGRTVAAPAWKGLWPIVGGVAVIAVVTTVGVMHARQVTTTAVNKVALAVARVEAAARLRQQRGADHLAAITPRVIPKLDQTLTLEARGSFVSLVTVPPGDHCHMTGWVKGLSVHDDFAVLVLARGDIVKWQANGGGKAILQTGKVIEAPIDAALPGPGTYGLVISNKASALLQHDVQVKAQLRCTSDWPGAAG